MTTGESVDLHVYYGPYAWASQHSLNKTMYINLYLFLIIRTLDYTTIYRNVVLSTSSLSKKINTEAIFMQINYADKYLHTKI